MEIFTVVKFVFQEVYALDAASYWSLLGQRPQGCTVQKVTVIDFLEKDVGIFPSKSGLN